MTILVIGNGFDLANHLPTQYCYFLNFNKALNNPCNDDYSSFIKEIKENNESLYLEIQSLIENNILIENFLSIYEDR